MYTVGLDVDTNARVFTDKKILLYAGNFLYCSPLVSDTFGKICNSWQSAGNFRLMSLTRIIPLGKSINLYKINSLIYGNPKNRIYSTYVKFSELPKISEHPPFNNKELTDLEFSFYLAGLIEGD